MASSELVRSVSPELTEIPRRVTLSRQYLSVDDSTNDECAASFLSSSLPPIITKEELNHLKKIQRLEKSKKWLQESPSIRSNRQLKSKIGLFRRVESVDESIQRRGSLTASLSPVTNKAIDDFGMEQLDKLDIDIFDQEETGNIVLDAFMGHSLH